MKHKLIAVKTKETITKLIYDTRVNKGIVSFFMFIKVEKKWDYN